MKKKPYNFVLACLFLSACFETQAEGQCKKAPCDEQPEIKDPNDRTTDIPGVLIGMTREEVVEVLGNNFLSFTGDSLPPVTDSFPYVEDGKTKYIWVGYISGKVNYAVPGQSDVYKVY